MKHLKLYESFINEAAKKISITDFKLIDKNVYETMNSKIEFRVKINGIEATGMFSPISQYTHDGVDINELKIGTGYRHGKTITITSGGGGSKTYAINVWQFKPKEKQPKDLRFTGRYYETSHLGPEFKKQLTDIVENHPEWLTDEFKTTFKIM